MSRSLRWVGRCAVVWACWLVLAVAGVVPVAGASTSPGGRAYELVSPVDKTGGEIMGEPEHTRVSVDGDAVQFASLSGFAGTIGASLIFEYMGVRTSSGWQVHSLMPPQEPQHGQTVTTANVPAYFGEFSDDLNTGVFRALSALTDDPNVEQTHNLYLRDDLLNPGVGAYSLLTAASTPVPLFGFDSNVPGYRPALAATSADFRHVAFDSRLNLVPAATGDGVKLYEWFDGTVRLVGILPNGQPGLCPSPANTVCSVAGRGALALTYTDSTVSRDGSRIFFSSPINRNSGALTAASQLYVRIDGTSTIKVNASERTSLPADTQKSALFWEASADGRQVFFSSTEKLTNDDNDTTEDLYRYDGSLPDADPNNLTRIAKNFVGVIGMSSDASYVYFAANNQGLVGEPTYGVDDRGIYALHNGQVRFIGSVPQVDADNMVVRVNFGLISRKARVSPNGVLTFLTSSGDGLTGYDHGKSCAGAGCDQVYVYDPSANGGAGELACASCLPVGTSASATAAFRIPIGSATTPRTSHVNRAVTPDGKHVFFMTRERLLSGDRNGSVLDVYEYDVQSHALELISPGDGDQDSYFLEASASGDDAFIMTRLRLVPRDTDNAYDLYDVRVGGDPSFGLLPPVAASGDCSGDACQGPAADVPPALLPATGSFFGGGNVSERVHVTVKPKAGRTTCKRGKVRKRVHGKVRCVKKSRHAGSARRHAKVGRSR